MVPVGEMKITVCPSTGAAGAHAAGVTGEEEAWLALALHLSSDCDRRAGAKAGASLASDRSFERRGAPDDPRVDATERPAVSGAKRNGRPLAQ